MSNYEVSALTTSERTDKRTRAEVYPLRSLDCGQQFIVPRDSEARYASVRATVSKFNRENPDKLVKTMLVNDGTAIKVYRDRADAAGDLPTSNPSEFELVAYLSTLAIGTVTQFQASYAPRFGQLQDWIAKMQAGTALQFECVVSNDVLTVTRLADRQAFQITPLASE
jgi:hypothetical protein